MAANRAYVGAGAAWMRSCEFPSLSPMSAMPEIA